MAVDVAGDRDARMTEDLRDHLERDASRQHDRGGRVPQCVQADRRRQFRALRRGLESTQRIAWITWLAQLCCEHLRSQLPHRASLSRSAICLVRRSRKTFSAVGESGTTRDDFAVFVSVTTSSPSTRARVPGTCRSLAPKSMSDHWRASASLLRKPLLTSRAKVGHRGCLTPQPGVSAPDQTSGRQPPCRLPWGVAQLAPGFALSLSRTAVSSTARKTVYAVRIEDSASPRPFSFHRPRVDMGRPELVERFRADLGVDNVCARHRAVQVLRGCFPIRCL